MLAARRALSSSGSGPAPPPALNLVGHWDASQITGVADGATLGQGGVAWPNLVDPPFGNLTGGNTGATGPTYYKTTAGKLVKGLPAVWFSTTGGCGIWSSALQWMATGDGSYSVYVVGHGDGGAATEDLVSSDDDASSRYFRIQFTPTVVGYAVWNTAGAGFGFAPPAPSPAQVAVVALTVDGTGLQMVSWINNVLVGTTALAGVLPTAPTAFGLGDVAPVGGNPLNGPVCEALVYQGAHNATVAANISKWLMAKWQ